MNGRLYDPILARMLSPDNYVQDATSTQGYNRYSYVINNPLKYSDPSGEGWEDFAKSIINILTSPARLPSTISDYIKTGNWDSDYLSGKQAPMAYRKDPAGLQSLGDYSGSLNSDFLGSEGGATDASGERIDMNAMNEEAWDNRSDRRDKAFLESIGNKGFNLPVTPIEAIRDDPGGVQKSWDRFLDEKADKDKSKYPGAIVVETSLMSGGAVTIPPFVFTKIGGGNNSNLMRHEHGHILQYGVLSILTGGAAYGVYLLGIGVPSILSADKANKNVNHIHQATFTEQSANQLEYWFLGKPNDWKHTYNNGNPAYPVYWK